MYRRSSLQRRIRDLPLQISLHILKRETIKTGAENLKKTLEDYSELKVEIEL